MPPLVDLPPLLLSPMGFRSKVASGHMATKERCVCFGSGFMHLTAEVGMPRVVSSDRPSRVAGEGLAQIAAHVCLLCCKHTCAVFNREVGIKFSDSSFNLEQELVSLVQ